jgi:hypothetical protein
MKSTNSKPGLVWIVTKYGLLIHPSGSGFPDLIYGLPDYRSVQGEQQGSHSGILAYMIAVRIGTDPFLSELVHATRPDLSLLEFIERIDELLNIFHGERPTDPCRDF